MASGGAFYLPAGPRIVKATDDGHFVTVVGSDTAQDAVPNPVTNIRGLELDLMSESDRAPEATTAPRRAQAVTAVFFNNQLK